MDDCSVAFKEWSVIVQALLEGRQTLILRKGGISENEGRFTIESREFFLYPTKVHQDPKDLINVDPAQLADAASAMIASDQVLLRAFAQVQHYERVRDGRCIAGLKGYHLWSEAIIDQRFHWGHENWLDLFVLRIFQLPEPLPLKNDNSYAGCKSWIRLATPLSTQGAVPVIPDTRFQKEHQAILSVLQKTPSAV